MCVHAVAWGQASYERHTGRVLVRHGTGHTPMGAWKALGPGEPVFRQVGDMCVHAAERRLNPGLGSGGVRAGCCQRNLRAARARPARARRGGCGTVDHQRSGKGTTAIVHIRRWCRAEAEA